MEQSLSRQDTGRIVWLDVVRLVAMFTVVCCHCTDPFNFFPGTSPDIGKIKFWGAVYGAALRPCVPLFVMITGALLLPVSGSSGTFYRKRIGRVFFPFLIWSVIYNLFPWVTGLLDVEPQVILDFFPYAGEDVMRQSFAVSLGYIGGIPFNFSILDVHMWYIYLLVGLYLFMPILSPWLRTATLRAKVAFLGLWGATLALHYWPLLLEALLGTSWGATFFADYATRFLGGPTVDLAATASWDAFPLLGQCDWNTFGGLYMFAGFVGYLVLGHVLREVRLSFGRTLAIGVPLVVVGYAIVALSTHWMWARPGCTAKMFEYFWWYCSIPVAMMSAGVFLLVKQLNWAPRPVLFLLKDLTKCGLGVFCAHYVFVTGTYYLLNGLLPIPLLVACSAVIGLAVAWTLVSLLERIHPLARRLLG